MSSIRTSQYPVGPSVQRDGRIDSIKGVLITLVCIGHEKTFVAAYPDFVRMLYHTHVPLFLALSCLFVRVDEIQQLGRYFRSRVPPVLVSYTIWFLIYAAVAYLTSSIEVASFKSFSGRIVKAYVISNIAALRDVNSTGVLWFLPCLLMTNCIFAIVATCLLPRTVQLIVSVVAATMVFFVVGFAEHQLVPWGVDISLVVLPLAVSLVMVFESKWLHHSYAKFVCDLTACTCCGAILWKSGVIVGLQSMILPSHLVLLFVSQLFVVSLFCLVYRVLGLAWFTRYKAGCLLKSVLTAVGSSSFSIYVTHILSFELLARIKIRFFAPAGSSQIMGLLYSILAVVVAISIGIAINKLCSRWPHINRLLFAARRK